MCLLCSLQGKCGPTVFIYENYIITAFECYNMMLVIIYFKSVYISTYLRQYNNLNLNSKIGPK